MILSKNYERITLLIEQGRIKEAKDLVHQYLNDHPDDFMARYYYALILFFEGENDQSREIVDQMLISSPEDSSFLGLSIKIDIDDGKLERAESKLEILLENNPQNAETYFTYASLKFEQRNYDKALELVNSGLALDPENIDGLNLKITIDGVLGNKSDANKAIATALEIDPENPSSIANHAGRLLQEGKVDEALKRLHYALSLDPNSHLARHYMQKALKSRFLPYRLFNKYSDFSAKLSAAGSWKLILGAYVCYRLLIAAANNYPTLEPFLTPLVYVIFSLFLLSWLMNPLMNLYLLTNKYGKVLLDKNDKVMAQACGGSLLMALIMLCIYFVSKNPNHAFGALLFVGCMIPLGSFLLPTKKNNRRITTLYSGVLVLLAMVLSFVYAPNLLTIYGIGLFAYQWIISGILIKENARIFE